MKWAATILIFCVAVLLGLGMVMLYSASMNLEVGRSTVGAGYLVSQLAWGAIGVALCAVAAWVDYKHWKKAAPWLLGFSAFLLVLVFVPRIGVAHKGAHRWIAIAGLRGFQPSELAKLALIVFLAAYGEEFQRRMADFKKGLWIPCLVVALMVGLIFIEPDRGCAFLLAVVAGVMLVVAGVRLLFLIPPALLGAALAAISVARDPLRLGRIMAWLHPEQNKDGAGYQAYQAMLAMGSGGLTGLGLGNGRQKLGFVPEDHTDFIFSVIGEELGLIATLTVLLLFMALVGCGISIARHSRDTFGLLLGCGLTFLIGIQAFINIGVVTSLLPNKGMGLPFISYGGSNLLLMLLAVGLLLSISRFASLSAKENRDPLEAPAGPIHE